MCFILLISFQSGEVEETLKRIGSHKGVNGIIVVNSEGKIICGISLWLIFGYIKVTKKWIPKVLARDLSTRLYDGHISLWMGRIKKFNRCDILKIIFEKVLLTLNLVRMIKQGHSSFEPSNP